MKKLSEIFYIEYGQREYHSKNNLINKKNGTPLISSKGSNRGIYGYFDIAPKYKHVISVPNTGTICFALYQGKPCCIDDNCLVLTPINKMTEKEMIYFSILIRKERYKYMYGRQVTPERLGNTIIPEVIPKKILDSIIPSYSKIKSPVSVTKISIKNKDFKEFSFKQLFNVKKGKRVRMSTLKSGPHIFISAIDHNNGVSAKTNLEPNNPGNLITVNYDGNGVAEAYYQTKPFWALDSVNVLYPKFFLNPYIAMFLTTIIRKEKYRFSYGRKWHKERMEKSKINLPIDSNGNPDWQFMEDYIKSLSYSKALA